MNHHISNCDRDYLQSTHKAPHKQWPLLMENIKPDRFTHLTHASLLQHQLPTAASPWGSHNPLCQWLAELNHLNSQLKALGPSVITQPHPYEGVQSPHQQLLSLPCTDSSNNWEPSWPKGFKAMFSSYFQNCCRPCQYSIPGLAVSGVIWNIVFCLPCPGLLLGQLLPPISLLVGRSLWSQGLKCPVISETGFLVAVREGIQDAKPVSAHFWYLTKLPAWLRRKVIYITLC